MKAQRPVNDNATLRVKSVLGVILFFALLAFLLTMSVRSESQEREKNRTIARCEGAGGTPAIIDDEAVCLGEFTTIDPPRRDSS